MKTLKTAVLFLFVSLLASCSSDDGDPVDNNPITGDDYFEYTIDGEEQDMTEWTALRSENTIAVSGTSATGRVVQLQFNKWGDIGDVMTLADDFDIPWRNNYHYNRGETFDFELVSIDEENKKIKVNFSGKVYDEEYDNSSDFSTIEGSFIVTYQQVQPQVAGLGVSAEIDGDAWHDSDSDQSGGFFSGEDLTINASSASKYTIGIVTNHDDTTADNYTFGPAETSNKMKLFVYNPETNMEEEWTTTSGSMNITEKTVGFQITVLAGTFSFTAENPETGETVSVTNGTFKQGYSNY